MSYDLTAINTVLLPEFQAWTDQWGLIQDNNQGITTGNGILYTAHYLYGLKQKKLLTDAELARIVAVFASCAVQPGLYKRAPQGKDGDFETHDDLLGIMGAEAAVYPDRSQRALTKALVGYGENIRANELDTTDTNATRLKQSKWALLAMKILMIPRKYVWNNKNPGTFDVGAYLGYRRDVIATMKLATQKWMNPLDWLYWACFMLLSSTKDNSGCVLRLHMASAAEGFGPLTNWVCDRARDKIFKAFPDFGQLLSAYFANPQHPLVNLLKDIK